ncbi:MAG: PIN domain-containing protein [Deltaproteobacteria bacterium]|nr:PIN domain-containing protein [Deltaproteobacteria bacterium]MBM4324122.1 PIN domain-containing protein [Deltaproteobacteria bacterium]MBM4347245.1 PIN domain-containing protein [Deltaproteobacteria bacterium]
MILIDTGPIVAFFDKDDQYHALCIEILKDIREPLVTTWPVLTECFYLLNFSWEVQDSLWLFIQRGGIEIYPLEKELLNRCRELMKQYRNLPMDLADGTLVVLADLLEIPKIFTLDQKDFSIYRFKQKRRFTIIPSEI